MWDNSISIIGGNNFSLQMDFGLETVLELVWGHVFVYNNY